MRCEPSTREGCASTVFEVAPVRAGIEVAEPDQLAAAEREALALGPFQAMAFERRAQRALQRRAGLLLVVVAEHADAAVAQPAPWRERGDEVVRRLVGPVARDQHRIDRQRVEPVDQRFEMRLAIHKQPRWMSDTSATRTPQAIGERRLDDAQLVRLDVARPEQCADEGDRHERTDHARDCALARQARQSPRQQQRDRRQRGEPPAERQLDADTKARHRPDLGQLDERRGQRGNADRKHKPFRCAPCG